MKIQVAEFTALLNDAATYGSVEKSLWAELEEMEISDMLVMEDDKSWYQKFGPKLTQSEPGLLEKRREKVYEVKIHFEKVVDKDLEVTSSQSAKTQTADSQATRIVRRIMVLVSDHGVALEFLRELFNAQDIKLAKVEDNINAPGTMGPD